MASRKNNKHRKKWFALVVAGVEWTIYLVEPEAFAEHMVGREGVAIFELAIVLIDRNLSPDRKRDVLWHELLHVFNFGSSLDTVFFGNKKDTDDREELLVSLQAPVQFAALSAAKMIRIPKIPAGW